MNIYEQKHNMEEAFGVYLKVCCGLESETIPYKNERLYKLFGEGETTGLYDITSTEDFYKTIDQLKANGFYDALTGNTPDEEALDFSEVLELYPKFLTAYQFHNVWDCWTVINDNPETEEVAKNLIVFGGPGTGKSYYINHDILKKTSNNEDPNEEIEIRVTFHPDMDYASFVGCYKPTKENDGSDLTYTFVPQVFTEAYVNAWKKTNGEPYYLVIEEINRGNCAQIFGDIFQLLDRRKDGSSEYSISPDRDLQDYLRIKFKDAIHIPEDIRSGKKMRLPKNLWILATMNTSDQSLFPMDSAFKRRWEWKYIPLNKGIDKDAYIDINGIPYSWQKFLYNINDRIGQTTQSEDKKIGYWFLGKSRHIGAETFVNKVIFYLWTDVFKDFIHSEESPFNIGDKKLTFSSFTKEDGKLNYENIHIFLKEGLSLSQITPEIFKELEESGQNTSRRASNSNLYVVLNGREVKGNTAVEVFKKAIIEIGVERVRHLDIGNNTKYPLIIEENRKFYSNLNDGLFVYTNNDTDAKKRLLEKIKEGLSINDDDFKVNIISPTERQAE